MSLPLEYFLAEHKLLLAAMAPSPIGSARKAQKARSQDSLWKLREALLKNRKDAEYLIGRE